MNITYSEFESVVLVIQHVMRMHHIVILALPFDVELLNTKCLFWFPLQILSGTLLILRRTERHRKMHTGLHVKHPLRLSDFNETSSSLDRFPKNSQISNFTKIRPVQTELFHADRRTDGRDEANSPFRNFANPPKK
jgi:hypothetical protein